MNPFALSGLLTGLTSLAMGAFVLAKDTTNRLNQLWYLFTGAVAVWGFGGMWIALEQTESTALLAWRVAFAFGVVWIPILFYHFVTIFCELRQKQHGLLLLNYAVGLAFFPFILFSPVFFGGVRFVFSSFYYSIPGSPLFHLFFVWWIWLVCFAHYQVFKRYQDASGIKRNQFKYFFIAFSLSYSTGMLDYLPIFGIDLYPYGNFGIILYPIITTYAIAKYRLMDITVVVNKGLGYSLLLALILLPVYAAVMISHRATPYSIPNLLAGSLIFSCGLWIVLNNYRKAANITFGLVCLAVCSWLFGVFMVYSSTQEEEARFWEKLLHTGVVYIPAFFYHFCVCFLQAEGYSKRVLANYLISTVFLLLIPTPYLIDDHYSFFWGYYPKAGPLHPLFLAYFASSSMASLLKLYRSAKAKEATNPLEATRIKYVFWAFAIGYLASADFAQSYGYEFYPFGYFFVTLWVLIVSYAILKYQLLDISLITKTPQVALFIQALALIPIYFAILLLLRVFTGSTEFLLAGVIVAVFSIFAGLFVKLQERMEKIVEKALFRKKFDAYQTLQDFSKAMVTILDLKTLIEEIERTLATVLGVATVTLYLFDKERRVYAPVSTYGPMPETGNTACLAAADTLPRRLAAAQTILVREEMEHFAGTEGRRALIDALLRVKADVCIPFVNKNTLIGFCALGPRTTRQMYSDQDLSLLTMLAQAAAIALDNAVLYEELKRSQTLVRRTDRLRSLETIAGGFAHEVRNPLTSIKTFIQLVPERKDDPEFIGHFGTVVAEDVARIERLIQEILDYARYMEPKFMEEDINDIVESCLYFVRIKADSKSVTLQKDLALNLPPVTLDRQQIKQVLLNLLLNAIEAIGPGGGRLIVETHRLTKSGGDSWVQVAVTDTGCGIASGDLDHIFDPFYTTKHASDEREGTGLGLTIVHQIVQEHGGHITVDSQVGRGTTFLVRLPINPVAAHSTMGPVRA